MAGITSAPEALNGRNNSLRVVPWTFSRVTHSEWLRHQFPEELGVVFPRELLESKCKEIEWKIRVDRPGRRLCDGIQTRDALYEFCKQSRLVWIRNRFGLVMISNRSEKTYGLWCRDRSIQSRRMAGKHCHPLVESRETQSKASDHRSQRTHLNAGI